MELLDLEEFACVEGAEMGLDVQDLIHIVANLQSKHHPILCTVNLDG